MKILVPIKRVADPKNANKVKVNGGKLETTGLEPKINPFCENAVETALRLTENAASPKARQGEVVVVTFGDKESEKTLRGALNTGADRAIRIDASDDLDGDSIARALKALIEQEKPDLVIAGKQQVDGDSGQVPQLLAEYLGWPQATFAGAIKSEDDTALLVSREIDGGSLTVRVKLPAVVSVDLGITSPGGVQSKHTKEGHKYPDGVRYASMAGIMAAKKKPLTEVKLADLTSDTAAKITYNSFELPPARKAGQKVGSVAELVEKLKNEAKAL